MSRRFVDEDAKTAFTEAIRVVEAASSAEVVIQVRHHSGSYLHADLIAGLIAGIGTLAFMLFSPSFAFTTAALFVDPIVVGVLIGVLSTQLPGLRRALTPARARHRHVREAAEAGFFRGGVRKTTGRTGMLVYVSLLERQVELVCDDGVTRALGTGEITRHGARLTAALRHRFDGAALAREIAALDAVCGAALPRSEDDVNELADEVEIRP